MRFGPLPPSFINTYSLDFDGVDDYIDIGNTINFEYTDSFSYSFWVNPDAVSGVKYLYSKYDSGRGILIYLNSSGTNGTNTLNFNLYNTNSGSTRKRITTNLINFAPVNVWTNIVLTYDGSGLGSGISFYKNGVPQGVTVTNDTLDSNTILTSQDAYISGNNFGSSFLAGSQDEWAIYNTELSSADALSIYNDGAPNDLTSLSPLAWYRFEEGSGTTALDSAGSNNGTIENGATYSTDIPT